MLNIKSVNVILRLTAKKTALFGSQTFMLLDEQSSDESLNKAESSNKQKV